jgi:hypothetical protein
MYQRVNARAGRLAEQNAAMLSSNRSQVRPASTGRGTRGCHCLRSMAARYGSEYLSQISINSGRSRSRILMSVRPRPGMNCDGRIRR